MKLISFVACGVCASLVSGATFKAPIYSIHYNEDPLTSHGWKSWLSELKGGKFRCGFQQVQRLLRPDSGGDAGKDKGLWGHLQQYGLEGIDNIWDWSEWLHITEISVGTPPQPFRVLLSISDSDIFIPSSRCDETYRGHRHYDSNLSSTYIANGSRVMGDYVRFSGMGVASEDSVHIAGIEVKNLTFGEATTFWRHKVDLGDGDYDGILGLAPSVRENNGPFQNVLQDPFLSMVSQGLLDRNTFGLKLSRGKTDPGEIMFGGINHDLYEGELKILPLLNNTDDLRRIEGRWKVPATSISIGGGEASLEGYAATLESDFPLIALPGNFVMLLEKYLGMESKGDQHAPKSIDCSKRDELEDFTVTLGEHDFVITPYEYTVEMDKEAWGGYRCISTFVGMPEIDEKYVIIGSSFLRAFYGVFDLDERTVSLGKLKGRSDLKSELRRK